MKPVPVIGLLAIAALVALVAVACVAAPPLATLTNAFQPETLRRLVESWGIWGPVGIVALMTLAILFSPLPSAPIALAAGAAYGHTWGTILVVLGSELGAVTAFVLARWLGRDLMFRWFGDRLNVGLVGSQNALMLGVLVSRLLPFLSFDLISYAAGLTVLSFWRFALATLLGIIPASFVLAHFGSEATTGEADRILITTLAIGALILLPLAMRALWARIRD